MSKIRALDIALLLIRVFLGVLMVYYGSQKALGIFGGQGFNATVEMMVKNFGIPSWAAMCAIAGELLGGLGVLAGALTRVAAFGVAATMATATYFTARTTIPTWATQEQPMRNFAYSAAFCVMALVLILLGGGEISFDRLLFGKGRRRAK